jgi:hypothetical protein
MKWKTLMLGVLLLILTILSNIIANEIIEEMRG